MHAKVYDKTFASIAMLLASLAPISGCGDDEGAAATTDETTEASNDDATNEDPSEANDTDEDDSDAEPGSSSVETDTETEPSERDAGAGADAAVSTSVDASDETVDSSSPSADAGGETPTEEDQGAAWFVVPTEVYSPDFATSTSYVALVSSLDVDAIELSDAKELDGRASAAAVGDWLFLASSGEPVINRYTVNEDGSLEADGSLNFSNYGVPQWFSIDPWGAVFVDAQKAFIFNGTDGSHVVWNPSTMQITGEIPGPDLAFDGYNLESIAVVRGNRMYRVFTVLNYDTWEFLPEPQYLAVYDLDTNTLLDLVEETRCPQLYSRPFIDEQGDIYFSGWVWTPGLTLTSDYPKSCALRVKDGEDSFDSDWQLNFADDVTSGREAGILRYLGDGKALLDVFHDERVEIDEGTDAQELSNTANWRLWTIDLEDKTGAPLEGLNFKAGGYQDVRVGNRTFLMVPNDNYSETTAYEVVDGEAIEGFKVQGSSYHMVRIAK